jgi:hypothetical protein
VPEPYAWDGSSVGYGWLRLRLLRYAVPETVRRLEGLCVTRETTRVVVIVTTGEPGEHISVAIGGAPYASLEAGRGM